MYIILFVSILVLILNAISEDYKDTRLMCEDNYLNEYHSKRRKLTKK